MPTFPLPDDPSLEQIRKQAKDLRDLARAGAPGALDLVAAHHPKGAHPITLTGAQLVLARHHGFASWARLKQHLEMVQRYRRAPDEVEETTGPADEFLALACLRYGGDDAPRRWHRAAQLLAEHPSLRSSSIHVAAAAADEAAVGMLLDAEPALASLEGGPYGWAPILYLAYARHDPTVAEAAMLGTAHLLLDHGADPNAGYLWHGLHPPFTALTGALGSGEDDQPQHPHGFTLASLLLDAGADANDGQALYNRQFAADDRHLVLLLEHGLGRGDGGPWRARLGHTADSPEDLVRAQLWWAIVHDMRARVRLLVEHGVDFRSPFTAPGGRPFHLRTSHRRTPAEVAALSGCPDLVEWLVEQGATRPVAEGVDGLIEAALAADRGTVTRLHAHVEAARQARPALIVWASARGKVDAVRLLAELGFDINARAAPTFPSISRGKRRCTRPRARATSSWHGRSSTLAPTRLSRTPGSAPPRSAGRTTSASKRRPSSSSLGRPDRRLGAPTAFGRRPSLESAVATHERRESAECATDRYAYGAEVRTALEFDIANRVPCSDPPRPRMASDHGVRRSHHR